MPVLYDNTINYSCRKNSHKYNSKTIRFSKQLDRCTLYSPYLSHGIVLFTLKCQVIKLPQMNYFDILTHEQIYKILNIRANYLLERNSLENQYCNDYIPSTLMFCY